MDQCGIMGGDDSSCKDCLGVSHPRGGAYCSSCAPPVCIPRPEDIVADAVRTESGVLECPHGSFLSFPVPGPNHEDECGTCDSHPSNDCVPNCRGKIGGPGYPTSPGLLPGEPDPLMDDCGICGGNSTECADCAGVPNGLARRDECWRCNSDPTDDCIQDCAGVWGRTPGKPDPLLDACGVCDGDGTTCLDCAGAPNGAATRDHCGTCDSNSTNDCLQDCTGEWVVPSAVTTIDVCGICGGDGSRCADCLGQYRPMECRGSNGQAPTQRQDGLWACPNGTSLGLAEPGPNLVDHCGTCDDNPADDCAIDCLGVWGGKAVEVECVLEASGSNFVACDGTCESQGGVALPPLRPRNTSSIDVVGRR